GRRACQCARHRLDAEALDLVADLEVVEAGDVEAALEALAHLADVVLEALQAAELALVDLDAVAHHAHAATAVDRALRDVAARHRPDPRDLEELAHLGHTEQDFLLLRREHAFQRVLNILDRLVDDVVEAN